MSTSSYQSPLKGPSPCAHTTCLSQFVQVTPSRSWTLTCGVLWHKYADLNHLRPIHEEVAAGKQGKADKRDRMPLAGSNNKCVKVCLFSSVGTWVPVLSMDDWRHRPMGQFHPHHQLRQVMVPCSTAVSLVTSMVLEGSSSAKNVRCVSILVSSDQAYGVKSSALAC